MATEKFANIPITTLNGGIDGVTNTVIVADPSLFPTQPQFRIRVENELMLVTGVTGPTFTATRGIEGTSAVPHLSGVSVTHILTAGAVDLFCQTDDARLTNDRTASGLRSATTVVVVSAATAPSPGQVLTATSGTAADWETPAVTSGSVQTIRYAINTTATQPSATSIPSTAVVQDCYIDIITPFSPGATIEVGRSGSLALIQATTDNDATTAGLYKAPQDTVWGVTGPVVVTVGGAPGAGAGFCMVNYVVPNA